jgi:hypothetical protein
MRRFYIIYIIGILLLGFTSCSNEELAPSKKTGTLELVVSRHPLPSVSTRAVDDDLNIDVIDPTGEEATMHFTAGTVPAKINLTADKEYRIVAFTSNQNTWQNANDGLGEPCFMGETTASVKADSTVYVNYQVPMINYAVTITLPELFNSYFKSYTFTVSDSKEGGRSVRVAEGQKGYFSATKGFFYELWATNTDERTSHHNPIEVEVVEGGKCYNIHYLYGTDINTGGIDIVITDDIDQEDIDF